MRARLAGLGGTLLPGRYLDGPLLERAPPADGRDRARRRLVAWWTAVERTTGPATGLRALVDRVAAPFAAALGFSLDRVTIKTDHAEARLQAGDGAQVALVVRPWASRPPHVFRSLAVAARDLDATWCWLVAPPYFCLARARGVAVRRSLDGAWPDALEPDAFAALWTLGHARAFRGDPAAIDRLVADGDAFQDRVRADLRHGVTKALARLAPMLGHEAGKSGGAAAFNEALTLVYRVLFLLFAESRDLVPHSHPIYRDAYALSTLVRESLCGPAGMRGLADALAAVTRLSRHGCRVDDLIVRPFNGQLFARSAAPRLESPRRGRAARTGPSERDRAIGDALVALGTRPGRAGREEINYADLGVEQLGAVYERVLELDWSHVGLAAAPVPAVVSARPRKETGTFYTPQPLAEFLVRRTLAPLVRGASADRILSLRVLDPAMGSGAFLVASCRYLAGAYERALIEEGRLHDVDVDDEARADLRRLIAERCLAGVDVNPVAVQLARLSLWLTTLARGKPLGFLDHRLRTGNSLLGIWPDDLSRHATGGPVRPAAGSLPLLDAAGFDAPARAAVRAIGELVGRRDESVTDVHIKEAAWRALGGSDTAIARWRLACHVWVARWFSPTAPQSAAEWHASFDALVRGDRSTPPRIIERWTAAAEQAAHRLGFFHWPLEFADVFYDSAGAPLDRPGFDAVLGNPPWEMMRDDGPLRPVDRGRPMRGLVRFVRESGLYPSCRTGHMNLYQPFVDRAIALTRRGGRLGLVLPWSAATDDGALRLRARLLEEARLDTIVGLDNAAGLFGIHRGMRFMAIAASPGGPPKDIAARFGVRTADEIGALPAVADDRVAGAYPLRIRPDVLARVGGPTRRIPDLRRPADLDWLDRLGAGNPPLGSREGWQVSFGRDFNATEDRHAFGPSGFPVAEGKHLSPFRVTLPEAGPRVDPDVAGRRFADGRFARSRLAYRDVSAVGNRFTLVAAVLPPRTATTHTVFCLREVVSPRRQHYLCGLFNSYVLNFAVRLLMGSHVTTGLVESLPVPRWGATGRQRRIGQLARYLSLARPAVRALAVEGELQALVAREYGLDRTALASLLDRFPLASSQARRLALDSFDEASAKVDQGNPL
jgi:hypothetical protein